MTSIFRQTIGHAVELAACTLGVCVSYKDCNGVDVIPNDSEGNPLPTFFVTPHSTNFQLLQNLEYTETSISVSIPKVYVDIPRVGDTFTEIDTGFVYEIDGVVLETDTKTVVSVRASKIW